MIRIIGAMKEELACIYDTWQVAKKICCGVGKVNAALSVVPFSSVGSSVRTILVIGTSGAADPTLEVGDVIVATDTLFHDVDVTALGFAPGQIPYADTWRWEPDSFLTCMALKAARRVVGDRAKIGRVVTGDRFVSDPADVARIHSTFNASAIDMETAAIAMAVKQSVQGQRGLLRWCAIRVISDRADKSASADFPAFLPEAAKTIGRIAEEFLTAVEELQ